MTPAELKTIRESLGLPLQWVAEQAGVLPRTAQYWEAGTNARGNPKTVPQDVADMLVGIDEQFWQLVADYLTQLKEIADEEGALPEEIVLIRYKTDADLWEFHPDFKPLPASAHAALLARTRHEISKLGILTVIQYMRPAEYRAWLDGRDDDESMRSEWALEQD